MAGLAAPAAPRPVEPAIRHVLVVAHPRRISAVRPVVPPAVEAVGFEGPVVVLRPFAAVHPDADLAVAAAAVVAVAAKAEAVAADEFAVAAAEGIRASSGRRGGDQTGGDRRNAKQCPAHDALLFSTPFRSRHERTKLTVV